MQKKGHLEATIRGREAIIAYGRTSHSSNNQKKLRNSMYPIGYYLELIWHRNQL